MAMRNGKLIMRSGVAALVFAALAHISCAYAVPPTTDGPAALRFETKMAGVSNFAFNSTRARANTESRNIAHAPVALDLRPPEFAKVSVDGPAVATHQTMGTEVRDTAGLSDLSMARPMSSAEELARRVHREGLPVARLFESKSALVSVGLNQRGKPGLWLIQKTH
jgi:hypothetical protein